MGFGNAEAGPWRASGRGYGHSRVKSTDEMWTLSVSH